MYNTSSNFKRNILKTSKPSINVSLTNSNSKNNSNSKQSNLY